MNSCPIFSCLKNLRPSIVPLFAVFLLSLAASGICRANTYATWKTEVFNTTEQADPTISGETANPSGDGINNLMKYALGLDPHQNQISGLPTFSLVQQNGDSYPTLTYRVPSIDPPTDLLYIPEATTDLQSWNQVNISLYSTTPPVNQGDPYFYTYLANLTLSQNLKAFMRLQIQETVVISLASGNLSSPQAVMLTGPQGSSIYYTIDGTTPSKNSILYSGPIVVNSSQTIKAQAYSNGNAVGGAAVASYSLDPIAYPPPSGVPTAPSNLTATSTSGEVDLSWTNNATNASAILVQQQNSDGSWNTVATLNPSQSADAITGLPFGTNVIFRVLALNIIGLSNPTSTSATVNYVTRYAVVDLGVGAYPFKITNSGYVLMGNAASDSFYYRWYGGNTVRLTNDPSLTVNLAGGGVEDMAEDGTAVGMYGVLSVTDSNPYKEKIEIWSPTSTGAPTSLRNPVLPPIQPWNPQEQKYDPGAVQARVLTDTAGDIFSTQTRDALTLDGYKNTTELGSYTGGTPAYGPNNNRQPAVPLNGTISYPVAVNNSGNVILNNYIYVNSNSSSVTYSLNGQTIPFPATTLSNAGCTTGYNGPYQNWTNYYWSAGTTVTLATPPDFFTYGINALSTTINGTLVPAYQILGQSYTFGLGLLEMNPTTGVFAAPIPVSNLLTQNSVWSSVQLSYQYTTRTNVEINDNGVIEALAYNNQVQHGVLLCPMQVVQDSNSTHIIDMTDQPLSYVRFGLWDNAFDNSNVNNPVVKNGNDEASNFVGSDSRRFYIRIVDPSAIGDPTIVQKVTANWFTQIPGGSRDDDGNLQGQPAGIDTVTLTETAAGSGIFVSKALMLVSDDVDNAFATNTGLTGGVNAGIGAPDHRLRRAALGDQMCFSYTPAIAGSETATVSVPIFNHSTDPTQPDIIKNLNVHIVNTAGGGTGALPIDSTYINDLKAHILARYAIAGIRVNFTYDVLNVPQDTAINLNSVQTSSVPTGDMTSLINLLRGQSFGAYTPNRIDLFLIRGFNDPGYGGLSYSDGVVAFDKTGAVALHCSFVAQNSLLGNPQTGIDEVLAAHEIGHQFMNRVAADQGVPGDQFGSDYWHYYSAGKDANQNMMHKGADDLGHVTDAKRIWDDPSHFDAVHQYQMTYMRLSPLLY